MYLPTLRQKVSSRAPVKRFSLYGSNYSDSLVFGNVVLQRSKITVSEQDLFNKKTIAMEALGMCLSYG